MRCGKPRDLQLRMSGGRVTQQNGVRYDRIGRENGAWSFPASLVGTMEVDQESKSV
jgi:hypothetical protein